MQICAGLSIEMKTKTSSEFTIVFSFPDELWYNSIDKEDGAPVGEIRRAQI